MYQDIYYICLYSVIGTPYWEVEQSKATPVLVAVVHSDVFAWP